MINSQNIEISKIASHYDELDQFYREVWGNHVHHGLWNRGDESVQEATEALIEFMVQKLDLKPGDTLCDVGCGYGETSRYLADKYLCNLTSFTISRNQYEFALKQKSSIKMPSYILGDWLTNDLEDNSMDYVFSIESSEHMPNFSEFFAQSKRVLKPNGKLAIYAWLENEKCSNWEKNYLLQPLCDEGRMRLGTVNDYKKEFEKQGLKLKSVDILSNKVSKTWTICIQRGLQKIIFDKRYRNYVLSNKSENREFVKTLFRIRTAFATNAMEYGLFIAEK